MKTVLISILLLSVSLSSFSQNSNKKNLNLVFYNECSDKIVTPEYDVASIPESENIKIITYHIERGEWICQNTVTVDLRKNDTIRIPRILFGAGKELHSKRWSYLNCDKICQGTESDFYPNGNKRLEGNFKDGKPSEIKFYEKNGILESQKIYEAGTLNIGRVNYFDEKGKLMGYELHKNKKRKTIICTFDKNRKRIKKDIRYYLAE